MALQEPKHSRKKFATETSKAASRCGKRMVGPCVTHMFISLEEPREIKGALRHVAVPLRPPKSSNFGAKFAKKPEGRTAKRNSSYSSLSSIPYT
jgi:hypothetical protein